MVKFWPEAVLAVQALLSPREGTFAGVERVSDTAVPNRDFLPKEIQETEGDCKGNSSVRTGTGVLCHHVLVSHAVPRRVSRFGNAELVLAHPQSSVTLATALRGRSDRSHPTDEKMEARFHDG